MTVHVDAARHSEPSEEESFLAPKTPLGMTAFDLTGKCCVSFRQNAAAQM